MRVMIVEDDPSTGALLQQLVKRLWPAATIVHFGDGVSALEDWRKHGADLVLLDWGLPGISGLAVLEQIRKSPTRVLCAVISGRADRQVVLDARKYQVDAYIVKPFSARQVMARLSQLVTDADSGAGARNERSEPFDFDAVDAYIASDLHGGQMSLDAFIASELYGGNLSIPIDAKLAEALEQARGMDPEDRTRLLRQCQSEPGLVARLLGVANSSPYNPGIQVCETFDSAFNRVGLEILINLATELALHPGSDLRDDLLATRGQALRHDALALFETLLKLHRHAEFDLSVCRAACMLHRNGEFALLQLLQRWIDRGNPLADGEDERILTQYAQDASQRINSDWGIPNSIRQRAGAARRLPVGTVRTDALAMRIAGILLTPERTAEQTQEARRLLSRIGVPEICWDDYLNPPPDTPGDGD